MRRFRVMLHGHNFRLKWDDGPKLTGFHTTRYVDAADPQEAELSAVQMIRDDPHFDGIVLNDASDSPMLEATEIVEVEPGEGRDRPNQGYTFYTGSED